MKLTDALFNRIRGAKGSSFETQHLRDPESGFVMPQEPGLEETSFKSNLEYLGRLLKIFFGASVLLVVILVVAIGLLASNKGVVDDSQKTQVALEADNSATETPAPDSQGALVQGSTEGSANTSLGTSAQPEVSQDAGWHIEDGVRFYFLPDGSKATGTLLIDGASVTFDAEGRWLSTRLDVPFISQLPDMPSGCEVVCVTMMLNHAGLYVTKEQVANRIGYASDPNVGYTGNLYAERGSDTGGIIWPSGLLDLVISFKGSALDLTGKPWEEIQAQIDSSRPVCMWLKADGLDNTVVLTGYSATEVWINNPETGKDLPVPLDVFLQQWADNNNRALSY